MSSSSKTSRRMAIGLVVVVVGMLGLSYAAVPLYDLFCRVTGFGGTTQRADMGSDVILDKDITIDFDANTSRDMPWEFKPVERKVTLKIGQTGLAYYEAYNPTDKPITGTASFNVSPLKVGQYFTKIECFCFTEQTLQPGQRVDMPVTFYVDPAIQEDINTKEVETITLSYTFFVVESSASLEDEDKNKKLAENTSASVN
ncbi:cytochrome c oxidase assembly protein [Sneathiella limimaris]|uniref:cytochrome c oxidase assembly protein n=1 Tax=Sneathiella limimaris TaxID=1964213 RepID=UPI00146EF613|nr:cytochrome c oxidase assembly protein [Sneathiella limimaris]